MKRHLMAVLTILVLAISVAYGAEKDHAGHGMNYGNTNPGHPTHQEVVDGIKATFNIKTMKVAMKEMGMEMPKGVKETHHLSASFNDMKTGKAITEGEVKVKVLAPDKSEETKDMTGMHGHFGADFVLAKKGKYGIMSKFKVGDGKTRSVKFWYEVK